jgi:hypothetical protein
VHFKEYFAAIFHGWVGKMSGLASVILAFLPIVFPGWFGDSKVLIRTTWAVAAICFLIANYAAWLAKRNELQREKAKNEVEPHIDMRLNNVIPHSSMGKGLTDLFINITLILERPTHVELRDYSLTIFDGAQTLEVTGVQDIKEWELIRKRDGQLKRSDCSSLPAQLTRPGDPVQGWAHFPLPNLLERSVQVAELKFKVNGVYGTCYHNIDGAFVSPDPTLKGTMRKRIVS